MTEPTSKKFIGALALPGLVHKCFTHEHEVCGYVLVQPLAECDSTLAVNLKIVVRILAFHPVGFLNMDSQLPKSPIPQLVRHFCNE